MFLTLPLTSKLDAHCGENANLGPTGYTPCELAAYVGGASHLASLCDALAEQSALARL